MLTDIDPGLTLIPRGIDFRHWVDPRRGADVEQLAPIAAGATAAARKVAL